MSSTLPATAPAGRLTVPLETRWEELSDGLVAKSSEWTIAAAALSDGKKQREWWDTIRDHYNEPCRRYHTTEHLKEMFGFFDEYRASIEQPEMVMLAIFFHDIVYEGNPRDDEKASADVFRKYSEDMCLPEDMANSIYDWIVRTADHKCTAQDSNDCKLFMDIDLAILGTSPELYETYYKNVSEEYRLLKKFSPRVSKNVILATGG